MILDFTDHAIEDLRDISRYTLNAWGVKQEEKYLRSIYQKFSEILESPARWRFRDDLFPRCQVAVEGRHLILFQVNEDSLLIVRILHGSMDLGNHIPENFID